MNVVDMTYCNCNKCNLCFKCTPQWHATLGKYSSLNFCNSLFLISCKAAKKFICPLHLSSSTIHSHQRACWTLRYSPQAHQPWVHLQRHPSSQPHLAERWPTCWHNTDTTPSGWNLDWLNIILLNVYWHWHQHPMIFIQVYPKGIIFVTLIMSLLPTLLMWI